MTQQDTPARPEESSRRYLRAAENFAKRPRKERIAILRKVLDDKQPVQPARKKKS